MSEDEMPVRKVDLSDGVLARLRRADHLVMIALVAMGIGALIWMWALFVVANMTRAIDNQSETIEQQHDIVTELQEEEKRAQCNDVIEAGFEMAAGELALSFYRLDPAGIEIARTTVTNRVADLRRVFEGEHPCDVVSNPS